MKYLWLIVILIIPFLVLGCDGREGAESAEREFSAARDAPAKQAGSSAADIVQRSAAADAYAPHPAAEPQPETKIQVYHGASDASAAVALGEDMFVMADDENNILRVYKIGGASPVYSYDVSEFLKIEQDHPEADIEGATMIGRRVYWITSHGRNKDGKVRPNRYRFFATDVDADGGRIRIRPVGKPCSTLLTGLLSLRAMRDLDLHKAAGFGLTNLSGKDIEDLAPKDEGLNIEGLCASADGRTIYVGFRNPRPVDKLTGRAAALVVTLNNPADVIEQGNAPVFGDPILWDLGGLGLRSMEYSTLHKAYFLVAGAHDETSEFVLYRWSGRNDQQPEILKQMSQSNFGPEALIPFPNSQMLLLLSDDGTLPVSVADPSQCVEGELNPDGTCPNKFILNPGSKTFRAIRLKP
ncbi:MAG TPA: DUF3616 domain-containing protein [Sedimentisphaerales bacterium]|nr:DUF3616 domain-containing protein [Sedimentisphaerales bacterium]